MNRRIPYSAALDGLRGSAVLLVLVYHGDFSWLGGGYLGVSTFFTLSGFLITSLLLIEREASGRIALREFWARRIRRLMPAALAGVALAALYARFVGTPSQIARLPWDAASTLLYFANFRFMTSGHSYWEIFSRPSPLQHYWSLSIEEQFYVVYPLLLMMIYLLASRARASLRGVLLFLVLVSTSAMVGLSLYGVAPARLYYGTDTRASEFLVGALLSALLVADGGLRTWHGRGFHLATLLAASCVVAVVALVEEDSTFLYRGGFVLYSTATAFLINAALQPGLVQTLLSLPPLVWAGRISYGAYIYHWPICLWLNAERVGASGVPLLLLQILVTLAAADVSYRFFEHPIRTGRWLRGVRALVALPATAALAILLVLLVTANAPRPVGEGAGQATSHEEMPAIGPRAPEGPVRVMVLGDSIGWNIGRGFARWAKRSGGHASVWNLAAYGCGLARGGERPRQLTRLRAARCDGWPEWWEVDVEHFQPDVVVILSGIWDLAERKLPEWAEPRTPGDPEFDDWLVSEYQLAVDIVSARGARVVWLTSPCVGPPSRENPLRKTGALEPRRIAHLNEVLLPRLVASRPTQVETYDLFGAVCPGGRYAKVDGHSGALRTDELHIGREASERIAAQIAAQVFPKLGIAMAARKQVPGRERRPESASGAVRSAAPSARLHR